MVPVEFKRFTRLFLRGSDEWTKDMTEFIRQAVRLLDADQKPVVRAYVGELVKYARGQPRVAAGSSGGGQWMDGGGGGSAGRVRVARADTHTRNDAGEEAVGSHDDASEEAKQSNC